MFYDVVKYEKSAAVVQSRLPITHPNSTSYPPVKELMSFVTFLMLRAAGRRAAADRKNKRQAAEKLSINIKTCGELGHDQS